MVVVLLGLSPARARPEFSHARSLGLAGAYSSLAIGAEATLYNPANLSLRTRHPFSMAILGVGVGVSNNAFSLDQYNTYNGAYLTEDDKNDILDALSGGRLAVHSRAQIHGLGIGYGPFALTYHITAATYGTLAREIFELALKGNELNKEYTFAPIKGEGIAFGTLTFSYGFRVPMRSKTVNHLGLGLSIKYFHGYSFARVKESQALALTEYSGASADGTFLLRSAQGGNGLGLDLGANITLARRYRLSLVIENLASFMSWNSDPEESAYEFKLLAENTDKFLSQEVDTDSIFTSSDSTYAISPFNAPLPSNLRLGLLHPVGRFLLLFEWKQGFRETALSSKTPRLAFGSEYRPSAAIQFRAGLAFGGQEGFTTSLGFGFYLGPLRWDFGASSYGGFFTPASKGIAFGTSLFLRN